MYSQIFGELWTRLRWALKIHRKIRNNIINIEHIRILVLLLHASLETSKLRSICLVESIDLKAVVVALAIFQALATSITLRRFCSRRILATHESAVFGKHHSVSASSRNSSTSNPDFEKETNLAEKPT